MSGGNERMLMVWFPPVCALQCLDNFLRYIISTVTPVCKTVKR
jgi:hypothetical protein